MLNSPDKPTSSGKGWKAFFVKTGLGKVEVMGTSFDVKAFTNENFEITLVEGSVKVSDKTNQVAILKPGQQSIITSSNAFTCKTVRTDLITSWKEGKLIFIERAFRERSKGAGTVVQCEN